MRLYLVNLFSIFLLRYIATTEGCQGSVCFRCVEEQHCIFEEGPNEDLLDMADCISSCAGREPGIQRAKWHQLGFPGICHECPIELEIPWNFEAMLRVLGLAGEFDKEGCEFSSSFRIPVPAGWTVTDASDCEISGESIPCLLSQTGDAITFNLQAKHMDTLAISAEKARYKLPKMSSPSIPGSSVSSPVEFQLTTDGCSTARPNEQGVRLQSLDMTFPFESPIRVSQGQFYNVSFFPEMEPKFGRQLNVIFQFQAGTIVREDTRIEIESDKVEELQTIVAALDMVTLISISPNIAMASTFENGRFLIDVPAGFVGLIDNGTPVRFRLHGFTLPNSLDAMPKSITIKSSREGIELIPEQSIEFLAFGLQRRNPGAELIDIISVVIFGVCMFISLLIIYWHGLPFSPTTIWTDMVAISIVLAFTSAFCANIAWILHPSKSYVYLSALQYAFHAVMIISICFHWASVLSLNLFKRITIVSPVVIAYFLSIACVFGISLAAILVFQSRLNCVYSENVLVCRDIAECDIIPASNGQLVRDAVDKCGMQGYYITLAIVFSIYTLLLLTLACMVMKKGRKIITSTRLGADDKAIRNALTIFYFIISITCILYLSAEILYIVQFGASGEGDHYLTDTVWYTFIVWLPQILPPLLMLFLQWNPSTGDLRSRDRSARLHTGSFVEYLSSSKYSDDEHLTEEMSGEVNIEDGFETPSSVDMSGSPRLNKTLGYSHLNESGAPGNEFDDGGNKIRLLVRLKLPSVFQRSCFVSLDYCTTSAPVSQEHSLRQAINNAAWKNSGSTERVDALRSGPIDRKSNPKGTSSTITVPFVAVLQVPVVGLTSNTLVRFIMHTSMPEIPDAGAHSNTTVSSSVLGDLKDQSSDTMPSMTYQPLCEFVTTVKAVMDATSQGRPLRLEGTEDMTCTFLHTNDDQHQETIQQCLNGSYKNAELSIKTVVLPGALMDDGDASTAHKKIGNIIRFFQYDELADGTNSLVVEHLKESVYANSIPRQLLEFIAAERQSQVRRARQDLHKFTSRKNTFLKKGFYGTLIGQIQDEGDAKLAREWLEARVRKRKEYVAFLRKSIQVLLYRDKKKQYFKASVDKDNPEHRFIPCNLHVQELKVGPTTAFGNQRRQRSKKISTYDFTTVGAMAAHVYKFKDGGILSMQKKLQKMGESIQLETQSSKWSEEIREYNDLRWDVSLRMDVCFAQALTALVASFSSKVELALQNPDSQAGGDTLRQLSTLGFLFQIESLLSTHGKEIGMIEDMAAAVAQLSYVSFVLQDVSEKPTSRFSFRMPKRRGQNQEEACISKATLSQKDVNDDVNKHYVVTLQVNTRSVSLPDKLAAGAEIPVTAVLFTQGINEMQTIANNTERAKTELQDMINMNNLIPLKAYCDKYSRLAVALPPTMATVQEGYLAGPHEMYRSKIPGTMRLSEDQVAKDFEKLETSILQANESMVKTKRPEILQMASMFCRELGAGRVTVCKSAKDRTAMSVTLEQGNILHRYHNLPKGRIAATIAVMRSHGVRIETALKNTGKRQYAFNKIQRSFLPEDYRCPEITGGTNVS